jgi:hypothetical protein
MGGGTSAEQATDVETKIEILAIRGPQGDKYEVSRM